MEEEKILTKEEKREERKKKIDYWKKIMFPDEMSVIQFFSMTTIDPGIVFFALCYVTATALDVIYLPLIYLIVDTILIAWWISEGFKYKKELEEKKMDRMDRIMQLIEELNQAEAERLRNEQTLKEKKRPWI